MNYAAVDYETYYDKEVSITVQGTWHYLRHPKCDIYMVSIATSTGMTYVGHPADFDWSQIDGENWTWLSQNASFDGQVYARLQELAPERYRAKPAEWHCTADMTAYLGYPRSLKEACKHLLKIELSKDTRDKMKGQRWEAMSEEFQAEVSEYALRDAVYCLQLWMEHSHKWPAWERELSVLTRTMGDTGVLIDKPYVEMCVGNLRRLVWEANKQIPWADNGAALSYKKLCEQCRSVGIAPPPSLAMDDEGCAQWEEQHGEKYPWVFAMRTKRRANTLLKKFEALLGRIRPDGRVMMPTKYSGAHTRRWCLPASYEVLTPNGWVKLGAWTPHLPIAQWHPDGAISWDSLAKKHTAHGGAMLRAAATNFAIVCTPDHAIPSVTSKGHLQRLTATEARKKRLSIPLNGTLSAPTQYVVSNAWMRFWVAAQADGHYAATDKAHVWMFSFKRARKIKRMTELLEGLNIPYNIQRPSDGRTKFVVLARYVPWFISKEFNLSFLLGASTEARAVFLSELVHWDGSRPTNSTGFYYYTTHAKNASTVATIAHLAGYSASIIEKPRAEAEWSTRYNVFIRATATVTVQPAQWKAEWIDAYTYCPQVATGWFLCRNPEGNIFVTGNSGDAGINAQNMSRDTMLDDEMKRFGVADCGVEMRKSIIAPAGKKLCAADLAQIEPRVLAVLSGNTERVALLRTGIDIYEAHARLTMGYDRPEPLKSLAHIPEFELMRRLAKARELGLGFQCGWHKFVTFAKSTLGSPDAFNAIFGAPVKPRQREAFYEALRERKDPMLLAEWLRIDEFTQRTWINSWIQVNDFREKNPLIVRFWRKMQSLIERSIGEDMVIALPSGNELTYHGVHASRSTDGKPNGYACHLSRMGKMQRVHIYGGLIVENVVQSVARDVFAYGLLNLAKAGKTLILQTHDESVTEITEDSESKDNVRLMTMVPEWMPTLPLAAEAAIGDNYAI